ncbi:MAG: DUF2339 domain-containing protein [Myxococcota bacterium]
MPVRAGDRADAAPQESAAAEPAPTRPYPTPPAPRRPRGPHVEIDWERWIGVRGAAVLGGIVLALAGLYFFQYSIENNLIPPWLRVVSGTLAGLATITGAELGARRRYPTIANALVGGGVVILYAAFWAASSLYGLIGNGLAFVMMVAVTGACTVLAYRHASIVIAMLGLIGGFATPMLLSTGADHPIALFSYILLLDGCLLFMAQRRGWPLLALVSLVGTIGYQALWIGGRMQPNQLALALTVLGIFAAAYAYALRDLPRELRREWLVTQGGATLFPFVFAIYLAASADLGEHFYPLAILLAILSASACWLGRVQGRSWLGLGAASGTAAVFAAWLPGADFDLALALEAGGLCVLLAGVFHLFVELDREPAGRDGPAPAAMVSALGLHLLLILAALGSDDAVLWPWLASWLGLAGLTLRHGSFARREQLQVAGALVLAGGWCFFRWAHHTEPEQLSLAIDCAQIVLVALAGQCLAMLRKQPLSKSWGEHAAAVFAAVMLISLSGGPHPEAPSFLELGTSTLLGFLILLAATRVSSGGWILAAVALTAFVHSGWTFEEPLPQRDEWVALRGLGVQLLAVALFTAWPFIGFNRLREIRWAWYGSALAGPAWFLSLYALYDSALGKATIGLLPIALGGISLVAAWRVRRIRDAADPLRKSNLAWSLAVALGFATAAIPLQLDQEWITIGWALEGLAVTILWRRLDHPGLKYLALALFAGVTIRLVLNEAVLGYYPRPEWRIVNWLFYTYLVPTGAMLWAARILAAREVARAQSWERSLYSSERAVGAIGTGLAAIVIAFVWINLAITDWFATGETLRLSVERLPARDLTTSIVWALYALGLLAFGVRGSHRGLRWLSLGLMMVTVVKVFLYDLGELEDLYRVASLLGLAVSLIVISFAYQRFVVAGSAPAERA